MITNLVQFLQAKPYRYIMCGIIKGIKEELGKWNMDNQCNMNNLDAFIKFSVNFGTTTIQTFGGDDTSHWTAFCANLTKKIHELTFMRATIHKSGVESEKLSLSNSSWLVRDVNAYVHYAQICLIVNDLMKKLW